MHDSTRTHHGEVHSWSLFSTQFFKKMEKNGEKGPICSQIRRWITLLEILAFSLIICNFGGSSNSVPTWTRKLVIFLQWQQFAEKIGGNSNNSNKPACMSSFSLSSASKTAAPMRRYVIVHTTRESVRTFCCFMLKHRPAEYGLLFHYFWVFFWTRI